ncbi:MAG TPA: hypothetical protein VF794_40030 [Archangium sp.]|jgi:hypothetical protein|uniref:hypothetical protein n=1 Tax=Archangium sp. TaxID=1872627 RepID=UPI002EDA4A01
MPNLTVGKVQLTNFSTVERLTVVKTAYLKVSILLDKAIKALKDDFSTLNNTEEARFTKWFGATTNRSYVLDRLKPMRLQLKFKGLVVREDLTNPNLYGSAPSVAAATGVANDVIYGSEAASFFDASAPLLKDITAANNLARMTIGPKFYTAPLLGTNDSQVGTIIHELSHLVSHTEDVEDENYGYFPAPAVPVPDRSVFYGETACKWLAQNRPLHARHNADSYLMYVCAFS